MPDAARHNASSDVSEPLAIQEDARASSTGQLCDLGFFGGDTLAGLRKIRSRLLDLTRNNRLLNYKYTKQSLRFIDKSPDLLYRQILNGDSGLRIQAIPEPDVDNFSPEEVTKYEQLSSSEKAIFAAEKLQGLNPSYDLPLLANSERHSEFAIQTLLFPEDLEAVLNAIRNKSRLAIEETGSNFLHLAFGFLEWFESNDSQRANLAPLILLPVEIRWTLNAKTKLYEYVLSYSGEELVPNLSLIEKLRSDFGLNFRPPIESENPEAYWSACQDVVQRQKHWKIRRWATLGLFQFRKLLIFQDLDPAKWPLSNRLESNTKIREFFEGQREGEGPIAEDFSIDDLPTEERELLLIEDADSSQHSAIVDVLRGKDLVIEGPPGTGKSQTITNLIGAALGAQKTVLFVSEKLAALEVVKSRLDKAGLGDFCLELHSEKTKKQTVFADLDKRLRSVYQVPRDYSSTQANLRTRWSQLKDLVALLGKTEPNSGKTVHEILHLATESRAEVEAKTPTLLRELQQLITIQKFSLPPQRHYEMLHEVSNLKSIAASICSVGVDIADNPWFGLQARTIDSVPVLIVGALEELKSAIDRLGSTIESFSTRFGVSPIGDLDAVQNVVSLGELLSCEEEPLCFEVFTAAKKHGEAVLEELAFSIENLQKLECELFLVPSVTDISVNSLA
jgi:hypothetical protein